MAAATEWFVYVIQSLEARHGRNGKKLPGFFYVGCTTDVFRRLREHNGLYADGTPGNPKGSRYTSKHRPWELRSIHGVYANQSEALKAEYALKHGKRGIARCTWTSEDSAWCRGLGVADPNVSAFNAKLKGLGK